MFLQTSSSILLPSLATAPTQPEPLRRPRLVDLALHIYLPQGGERVERIDPSTTCALAWSDRAVDVLSLGYRREGAFGPRPLSAAAVTQLFGAEAGARLWEACPGLSLTPEGVLLAWHGDAQGVLPAVMGLNVSGLPTRHGAEDPGRRGRLGAIVLDLEMPDGLRRTHTLDPKLTDALFWSDAAVRVFRNFYAPWGPAAGKVLGRDHFDTYFGAETSRRIFAGAPSRREVVVTPAVVDLLWTSPKDSGFAPSFLAKSVINPINGI